MLCKWATFLVSVTLHRLSENVLELTHLKRIWAEKIMISSPLTLKIPITNYISIVSKIAWRLKVDGNEKVCKVIFDTPSWHLVDTATALVSHNCIIGSVEICRTKDLLKKMLLVEWYFHDVVFTHPHKGLHSPVPFGFRPSSLGQPWPLDKVLCILLRYVSITMI